MLYAVDTNVIIDILRGEKIVKQKLIETNMTNKISIPQYCCYEIIRGILDKNATRQLSDFRLLQKILYKPDVNENDVMEKAADIYIKRKKSGLSIEDADILISAWCIIAGATLVTANTKHFININGLDLQNWRD